MLLGSEEFSYFRVDSAIVAAAQHVCTLAFVEGATLLQF